MISYSDYMSYYEILLNPYILKIPPSLDLYNKNISHKVTSEYPHNLYLDIHNLLYLIFLIYLSSFKYIYNYKLFNKFYSHN